jgi:hypothetical protein
MSPQAGELLVQEIVPRIRSLAHSLTPIGCEDQEELARDATAIAAKLLVSTEARAKKVTPGNIAYYAVGLVRQGRRSTGLSTTDVMHPATQLKGRSSIVSLDEPYSSEGEADGPGCLHESLADRTEDPAMTAVRHLDWEGLLRALDTKAREVLLCLVKGHDLISLVPILKRSHSTLRTDRQRLARLVREQFGPDILVRVQEQPRWRDTVLASRAKAARRYERQAA